jgi:hypothetical protein
MTLEDTMFHLVQLTSRVRRVVPALLASLLLACGGGGGSGPADVAATFSRTPEEASAATQAALAGASDAARNTGELGGLFLFFGGPPAALGSPPTERKQALQVVQLGCSDLLEFPCSGSASADTNISGSSSLVAAGDYIDISFNQLSGIMGGDSVGFDGRMRMDFRASFDLNASSMAGLNLDFTFDNLRVDVNGASYGPINDTGTLLVDGAGIMTVSTGGRSYTGLTGVSVDDGDNFVVGGGSVRMPYRSGSAKHVDIDLQNWQVVGGRTLVGSSATLTAANGSVSVLVTASSALQVRYAVVLTVDGVSANYIVTADYPEAGGAPTYTVVAG